MSSSEDEIQPKKKVEELPEKTLTKEYGKGFKMLQKMGFKTGQGLGPAGREGIVVPLEVAARPSNKNEGLQEQKEKVVETREQPAFDQQKFRAHRDVEIASDRKKNIQYKLWALSQEDKEDDEEDLSKLLEDVLILNDVVSDWTLLKKYSDALRDKYEFHSGWYSLKVEDVIASAAAEWCRQWKFDTVVDIDDEEDLAIITELREIVLDDEMFDRIIEFDILPKIQMNSQLAKILHATSPAYSRLYEKYIEPFVKNDLLQWAPLVPPGATKTRFISTAVALGIVSHEWRSHFTPLDWRDLVHSFALRWSGELVPSMVPPLVIGFLLVQSGRLQKEYLANLSLPVLEKLAKVCYHGPGRRMIVDAIRGKKPTPQRVGPPRTLFAATPGTSLGDVLRDRGFSLVPTGRRENGQPVFQIDQNLIYFKNECLFKRVGDNWIEISISAL